MKITLALRYHQISEANRDNSHLPPPSRQSSPVPVPDLLESQVLSLERPPKRGRRLRLVVRQAPSPPMTPTKPILDFARHLLGGALTGMERKQLGVGESKARPEDADLKVSELEPPDDLDIPK